MAQCVQLELSGDGSYRVVPLSSPDLNSCAYVIQSGAEVGNSLFDLTPSQGLEISMYVCGLWALAWGYKQIAKTLSIGDSNETDQ
jgi:hypothetical protein